MEALAILFWLVVLVADIAFMTQISRLCRDFEHWLEKSAQRRRAGRAKGRHKRTDIVYHTTGEDAR